MKQSKGPQYMPTYSMRRHIVSTVHYVIMYNVGTLLTLIHYYIYTTVPMSHLVTNVTYIVTNVTLLGSIESISTYLLKIRM